MARIVTCECSLEFFDTQGHTLCGRCRSRKTELEAKMARLTAHYRKVKAAGKLHIGFAMIDLYWREQLTIEQTAEVLGISVSEAKFERDIVRQNSK